ncbi:MAG: hypothetical protein AB8G15_12790 [Saprospiraceae bacterium]
MALFKQIMGAVLLFGFIGFLAFKLDYSLNEVKDGYLIVTFVLLVVLMLVMGIRRVLRY